MVSMKNMITVSGAPGTQSPNGKAARDVAGGSSAATYLLPSKSLLGADSSSHMRALSYTM